MTPRILSMFREAAAEATSPARPLPKPESERGREARRHDAAAHEPKAEPPAGPLGQRSAESEVDVAADEQRASALADRLRGDPDNHAVALELADVLARLQKDLELFALLIGSPGRRQR